MDMNDLHKRLLTTRGGARAAASGKTAGKGKQRIEDGFFHGAGFVVN